jgi:hypothetical protein
MAGGVYSSIYYNSSSELITDIPLFFISETTAPMLPSGTSTPRVASIITLHLNPYRRESMAE